MRIVNNKTCKQCIYFMPEDNMCCLDSIYQPTSPRQEACNSFASDSCGDDDYDEMGLTYMNKKSYKSDIFDDEDDFYDEDDIY